MEAEYVNLCHNLIDHHRAERWIWGMGMAVASTSGDHDAHMD